MTSCSWAFRRSSVRRSSARRGRGVVGDLARGEDRAADRRRDVARVAHLGGEPREARRALRSRHALGDLDAPFDEGGQIGEGAGLEVGPPHPGAGQGLGRVGQVVVGLSADGAGRSATASVVRARASRTAAGSASGRRALRRAAPSAEPACCSSSARIRSNSNALKELAFTHQAPAFHPQVARRSRDTPEGSLPRTAEALPRVAGMGHGGTVH